jgi:hypothetical protein
MCWHAARANLLAMLALVSLELCFFHSLGERVIGDIGALLSRPAKTLKLAQVFRQVELIYRAAGNSATPNQTPRR